MLIPRQIRDHLKNLIPPLDGSLHKGQSGRIGVLGGALSYTGAPYFTAISALRSGVDLSHIICSPTAASAIKSYSPDLIVHPILREDQTPEQVKPALDLLLSRLHVLVIGPGLGHEPFMAIFANMALSLARDQGLYVVVDAGALRAVGKDLSLLKGYRRAVVTPNIVEFKRLSKQLGIDPETPGPEMASLVSKALGGVTVLQKGKIDIISTNTTRDAADLEASLLKGADEEKEKMERTIEIDVQGGLKRCGGQGDVLSGCVGTFLAWGKCYEDSAFGDKASGVAVSQVPFLAAIGGSMVTRTTSRRAFLKEGRGLVTEDIIPEIRRAFAEVFGEENQGEDIWGLWTEQ